MQLRPRRTLLLLPLSTIFHRTPSSPATLFRCSFIASPSSRFQDPGDVTRDNSWVEEEWPTRSQTRFRFTCPLCISAGHAAFALFRLFRLVCRPPISHRDSIVYIHDGLASILSWCREVDRFCWRNVSIYIYSREIYFRVFSQEDGSRICYVIIIFEKDFYSSSFWIMLIMFWTIFLKRWIDGCSRLECVDKMDGWKRIVWWKSERRLWEKIQG